MCRYVYDLAHIKFHIRSVSGSLVIVIEPDIKEHFWRATKLLFYILQRNYMYKICIFFKGLLPYIISESCNKWH
jgi:hypothetical protein